jgi:hypothetical protein
MHGRQSPPRKLESAQLFLSTEVVRRRVVTEAHRLCTRRRAAQTGPQPVLSMLSGAQAGGLNVEAIWRSSAYAGT